MNTAINLVILILLVGFLVFRFLWFIRIGKMMEALAEAKGYKGNTQIFSKAIHWTGVLGALLVVAMPDKSLRNEVEGLRKEIKALREELNNQTK